MYVSVEWYLVCLYCWNTMTGDFQYEIWDWDIEDARG